MLMVVKINGLQDSPKVTLLILNSLKLFSLI